MQTKQQLDKEIKRLNLEQNALKILINSFYGAFGNKYFYFHDTDIAQSITLQGQDLIKFSIKAINHYFREKWHIDTELHEKLGISQLKINKIEEDSAIYTDTDSCYVCFHPAIKSIEGLDLNDKDALKFCLAINRERLKDYFKAAFQKYASAFNTNNRQDFELENLSRAAIWCAKKKYVLKVSYEDNPAEELAERENQVVKGLEKVQSSYPIWARNHLEKLYDFFLDRGYALDLEGELIPKLQVLRAEMESLTPDDISFSFSVRTYDKYVKSESPLRLDKGAPIYTRAAAYHNFLLKETGNKKYNRVVSGKVKFYYATQNQYDFDIFAFSPGVYPSEFAIPMDKDQQFFRLICEPLNKLLLAMGLPQINLQLRRAIEVVKHKPKKGQAAQDFPIHIVDSETFENTLVPESLQEFIANPELAVPPQLMPQYLNIVSKYGLNTVVVPDAELAKYIDKIKKKKTSKAVVVEEDELEEVED